MQVYHLQKQKKNKIDYLISLDDFKFDKNIAIVFLKKEDIIINNFILDYLENYNLDKIWIFYEDFNINAHKVFSVKSMPEIIFFENGLEKDRKKLDIFHIQESQ